MALHTRVLTQPAELRAIAADWQSLCELCVVIPSENMQVIEDLHLSVSHSIFTSLRARISDLTSRRHLTVAASGRRSS